VLHIGAVQQQATQGADGPCLRCLLQGVRVFTDTWIGLWFGNRFDQGDWFYIGIYAGLGLLYGFTTFVR
jgi:ATP-binding cassette subfamily C (CFTR/MRP) protein 1